MATVTRAHTFIGYILSHKAQNPLEALPVFMNVRVVIIVIVAKIITTRTFTNIIQ
jgi:hypothetical protein